jgi:hypothetical protein
MTSPTLELPPLPASQAYVEVWDSEVRGLHQANAAYYTVDQMRSYALEVRRQALEEAQKACEMEGEDDGGVFGATWAGACKACAEAIRALK